MFRTPKKGSNYIYEGIAPSRSVYDEVYIMFIDLRTGTFVYRKALRWNL